MPLFMPRLLLFLLLVAALPLRADFVIERKITVGSEIRHMVLKFKGDRARIEIPKADNRKVVLLLDLGKDEIFNLVPDKKVGFAGKLSERRESRERALASHGIKPGTYSPTRTGQTKRIGEWLSDEYVIGAVGLRIWTSAEFPRWQLFQEQLARFSKAESGGALSPDCFGLPGLVIEYSNPGEQGVELVDLESAREEAVPESDLVVPEGYDINPFPATSLSGAVPPVK
jgi:hypothetical protein